MDFAPFAFFLGQWRIELIGLLGTVIGVLSRRGRLTDGYDVMVYLLSGFALASVYTEPVRTFLNLEQENASGISFLLGLLGGEIVTAVIRVCRKDYLIEIIKTLIKRRLP